MASIMLSCGPSKKVITSQPEPCANCLSDKDCFRSRGQHVAIGDRQIQAAYNAAAASARSEIAAQVNSLVKRVVDNYTSEYIKGDESDFGERFQDLSRTVINQELSGAIVTCRDKEPGSKEGDIIVYVCVELTGKKIVESIAEQVNADEKLRLDFEYEKFKKEFNSEMDKLNAQ